MNVFAHHGAVVEFLRDYTARQNQHFKKITEVVKLSDNLFRISFRYQRTNIHDTAIYSESLVVSINQLRPYYAALYPERVCLIGNINGHPSN